MLDKYVKAQELLQEIVEGEIIEHEVTIDAIFNLCELLIIELKTFGNENILIKVDLLTQRLLQIGRNQNSFSLLAKTYLLMAKLALLEPDIKQARDYLVKARTLADDKGYNRLALVIATEQKRLEGQIPDWLLEENVSLFERLNKINLESLVISLRQNRVESYGGEIIKPSMEDLQSFAAQLSQRKFDWGN